MAEAAEKTEPATPKKRQDAREKGDVAKSADVPVVFLLAAATMLGASAVGVSISMGVVTQAQTIWSGSEILPETLSDYHALLIYHMKNTGLLMLPAALVIVIVAILSNVVQTGPMLTFQSLSFKGSKLNPGKGIARLVKPDQLINLPKAIVKICLLLGLCWLVLRGHVDSLFALADQGLMESLAVGGILTQRVIIWSLVLLSFLAAIDIAWVRYRYSERLKMSKQEVRDESRQREGNPELRGRMRARMRDMSRSRMIAAAGEADVVVTNPTHYAVALRYVRENMGAPTVVAKGRNFLALRIRGAAEEAGVPIVENPPLAQLLYRSSTVGKEVPESLYQAVAEILAYVYRLDPTKQNNWSAAQ